MKNNIKVDSIESKKSWIFWLVILIWLVTTGLLVFFSLAYYFPRESILWKKVLTSILLIINSICLSYFWLNSIRDFLFNLIYLFIRKKLYKKYQYISSKPLLINPKVVLLYCTRNDFNKNALLKSMKQDYKNYEVVILDDSDEKEYINEIDSFVKEYKKKYNISIERRSDHSNFKAGNLNNYLKKYSNNYEYFVVLDSDEIIPENFIVDALKYFQSSSTIGIVQATHISAKCANLFQKIMSLSIRGCSASMQIMKNFYGSNSVIGHGIMVSKYAYEKVGSFPNVVAEDISFAADLRYAGLNIVYAPNIVCQEEFPLDYVSMKKRQSKWTQGNIQFIKKYNHRISKSKMLWFEKLDTKLSYYSLPIVPIFSLFIIMISFAINYLAITTYGNYMLYVTILSLIFLLTPLIPNIFAYRGGKEILLVIPNLVASFIAYGSIFPMLLKTVFLSFLGKKAKFIVTPKRSKKYNFLEAIKYTYDSLIFGAILLVLTILVFKNPFPTLLVTASCLLIPFVFLLSNVEIKDKDNSDIKELY